jgi:Type VI secretion system, TssN
MFKNKHIIRIGGYTLLTAIVISAISLLQWVDISRADWYYYISQLSVLGIGFIHVRVINRLLAPGYTDNFSKGLLITLLIIVLSIIVSLGLYHFLQLNYSFLTFTIPFIIPFICRHSYRYFSQII